MKKMSLNDSENKDFSMSILPFTMNDGELEFVDLIKKDDGVEIISFPVLPSDSFLKKGNEKMSEFIEGFEFKKENWIFLGEMKIFDKIMYCYGVDVTENDKVLSKGCVEMNVTELADVNDMMVQGCFFKLFLNIYKHDFSYGITES